MNGSTLTRRQFLVDGSKVAAGASAVSLLAACGGSTDSTSSGSTATLQYWVLGYQPKSSNVTGKLTDAAIAAFLKGHSGTRINITGFSGDQAGFTKLTQAVQGGGAVDVFRLPSDVLALLVKQSLVAPIDDFLTPDDKNDIFPICLLLWQAKVNTMLGPSGCLLSACI